MVRGCWLEFPKRCLRVAELGPVTCAGCALLCDDVVIERSDDELRLRPRCDLGAAWFSERLARARDAPRAAIRGEPADVDAALARASELLRGARRPLVHGFNEATVEDARAAVALADRLGALVGTGAVGATWPGAPAVPLRGASTATLGEIRDRSEVVVIWREDPETTHPRLLDRVGFGDTAGPRLGANRSLVVIDDRDTATASRADLQLRWPPHRDLEALTALHVMQRKLAPRTDDLGAELGGLLERIDAVPHVSFVHGDGLAAGSGGQRRVLALHELVRELSHDRHVVTLALAPDAGTRTAQEVLAWQTGYSENVDLASGHPELVAATESLIVDEAVDVSLCIEGAGDGLGDEVAQIALGSRLLEGVEVSIRTAAAGVGAAGTAHRLDGVPLALQAALPDGAPTSAALLARLLEEIAR
jgi:formylmethanofuran dehydrogenase subunit B